MKNFVEKNMHKLTKSIILLVVFSCCVTIYAQNATNSPYSRFGYGELNDNSTGLSRSMGGLSIGLRQQNAINSNNPATYSAIDTTTFAMDLGVSLLGTFYGDSNGKNAKINGNLEYLCLQFPIWKYIGFSAGILPYSATGYEFELERTLNANAHYSLNYYGEGNISEVYGGLSFNILNWFAAGANIYYMWGEIANYRGVVFTESGQTSVIETSEFNIHDYRLRYGAQLFHTFGNHGFTIGAIFEPTKKLNGTFTRYELATLDTTRLDNSFDLPMEWGVGLSYCFADNLTIGVDYKTTDWSNAMYFGQKNSLKSQSRLSLGIQYRHNAIGRNYGERMYWRVGAFVKDSYIQQSNSKDFGVSMGFGFPLRNIGTIINTTFEYGHRGTRNTLEEHYVRFTLSTAIAENWFFKRRL